MTDIIIRDERYVKFNIFIMLFGIAEFVIFALDMQNLEPISNTAVQMSLPLGLVYIVAGYIGLHVHYNRAVVIILDAIAFLLIGTYYLL